MLARLNFDDFIDYFKDYHRKDQFSYEGFMVLWDHLESFEQEYMLDVVGLCTEYVEIDPEDFDAEFGGDPEESDRFIGWAGDNVIAYA